MNKNKFKHAITKFLDSITDERNEKKQEWQWVKDTFSGIQRAI